MDAVLLKKIKKLKKILLKDGFEIIGVFGSFARGEEGENSDIDLLYDIKPLFVKKYSGFQAFEKLDEIKQNLKQNLKRDVDIATIDNNSKIFQKYALRDIIYV